MWPAKLGIADMLSDGAKSIDDLAEKKRGSWAVSLSGDEGSGRVGHFCGIKGRMV